MFDMAFTEMMVIAVVALLVIGPKQLPVVARQAGQWISKMRRYVEDVKNDFNRQGELAELRKIKDEFQSAASGITDSVQSTMSETQSTLESLNQSLNDSLSEPSTQPTDWDKIWATRRTREKIKERRQERIKELGLKRSKFRR